METLEVWLIGWLSTGLNREVALVLKEQAISVRRDDLADVSRWMQESVFTIDILFPAKADAASMSLAVQRLLGTLPREPWFNAVSIDGENAERASTTRGWRYNVSVRIRHRRREAWPRQKS